MFDLIYELPDLISELPIEVIIFLALLAIGLIISIVKKTLKLAILIMSVLILLFVLHKLTTDYFQFHF